MSALLWIAAHWEQILGVLIAFQQFASLVVGLLPESALKSKGLAFLAWLSNLTPKDAPGTFKRPLSAHPLPSAPAIPSVDGESSR